MLNEVKKLQNEPVSEKALNDQRNVYLTGYYLMLEGSPTSASDLARQVLPTRRTPVSQTTERRRQRPSMRSIQ